MTVARQKVEFGDFQTPDQLACRVCERLAQSGITPDVIIEPTCGSGSFVLAACHAFPHTQQVLGFDINATHLERLRSRLVGIASSGRVQTVAADFFAHDWESQIQRVPGELLVLGNLPWVTSSTQGVIKGENLPQKSNFLGFSGLDAVTGKANFDISEWMMLEVMRWFRGRTGTLAMLAKTSVARKIIQHAERQRYSVTDAYTVGIDAKKDFGASVDACLLVITFRGDVPPPEYLDYRVYASFQDLSGRHVGHRSNLGVSDLQSFERFSSLAGTSPQKWRSGIKHDASSVMELVQTSRGWENGFGEIVDVEQEFVYPLMKGSEVGSGKGWRGKHVIVTQTVVGQPTGSIRERAPKTWAYLCRYADLLAARKSTIYAKNPQFSIFGVGNYTFLPWKIAICGLYKSFRFRLLGPVEGRPLMFDDTAYFVSFACPHEAEQVFNILTSEPALGFLSSLTFWDEKRPIKAGILNALDWSRLTEPFLITAGNHKPL
ncbi:hypothetical protein SAMN05216486_11614 [bacterium JGI 053]|nr:hypothetical protein SAMN05216486_11614 [bacterium JGI 053]